MISLIEYLAHETEHTNLNLLTFIRRTTTLQRIKHFDDISLELYF